MTLLLKDFEDIKNRIYLNKIEIGDGSNKHYNEQDGKYNKIVRIRFSNNLIWIPTINDIEAIISIINTVYNLNLKCNIKEKNKE